MISDITGPVHPPVLSSQASQRRLRTPAELCSPLGCIAGDEAAVSACRWQLAARLSLIRHKLTAADQGFVVELHDAEGWIAGAVTTVLLARIGMQDLALEPSARTSSTAAC